MAQGVGLETDLTAGYVRAAAFLDPILSSAIPRVSIWDQAQQQWQTSAGDPQG